MVHAYAIETDFQDRVVFQEQQAAGKSHLRKKLLVCSIASVLLLTSGCAGMPKATSVSIGGAVAGAAAGSRYGLAGMVAGAAIGGFIGNKIGEHFDEEDRKTLAALELKSLESGKSSSFVTNKTKAKVTVTPESVKVENVRSFGVSNNVEAHQLKIIAPQETRTLVATPVFNGMDEKATPKLIVQKGEVINIPAHVESNPKWAAVVEGENVIGYVALRYFDPKAIKQDKLDRTKMASVDKSKPKAGKSTPKSATQPPSTTVAGSSQKEQGSTASASGTSQAPVAVAVKSSDTPLRTVQAVGACRILVRAIDTGNQGEPATEKIKYCQEPPPKWKVASA